MKKAKPARLSKASSLESLKPGDLIEIIAPGSYSPAENLEKGAEVLRGWGYRVSYSPDLLNPELSFLANTDERRFQSLKKAFQNRQTKAIWCLRGGYGAIRLLPDLQKMAAPANPKLLIGLSDVSSLHAVINQKWKMPTLHASLIDRLAQHRLSAENLHELHRVLEDPAYVARFENLRPLNAAARRRKKIVSRVVGGNLMVVTSTLGTPSQIQTARRVLFLEEISERAYRIDRCLQQMKQAGIFTKADAVVFGDFTGCHEPTGENNVWQTIEDFFSKINVPAFSGLQSGHGEVQRPVFFNTEAHITCGDSPQMLVYSAFSR